MHTILVLAALTAAHAQPLEGDEEDVDLGIEEGSNTRAGDDHGFEVDTIEFEVGEDDDIGMADFVAAKKKQAPPPTWFHLDPTGRTPLADDWEIQHVATGPSHIAIQLPVLVAQSRSSFAQSFPQGLALEAVVRSGSEQVVLRQTVTADAVYQSGPTWAFFHTALPASGAAADVSITVRAGGIPAEGETKLADFYTRSRKLTR